jgi:hypothetical protein
MSKLTIFRGLPGSGKTTRARKMAAQTGAILIEPDALLVQDGIYQYSPERYAMAVMQCESMIDMLTYFDGPLDDGSVLVPDIIYADVLPRRADVRRVIDQYYFPPSVEVIDCIISRAASESQNRHNVRPEDLDRMAREWEPWGA